jgi:alkylation response protein AidB-like acyl-CoA dehydrogenase
MNRLSSTRNLLVARRILARFNSSSSTQSAATTTVDAAADYRGVDLFNPTEEHSSLRQMLRNFAETEIEPQALQFNREERFNEKLFRKLGTLGLLGITVEQEYGGSGMDASAAVIAHGKKDK